MEIIWSPEAVTELRRRYGDHAKDWRLVYDTEGCGCAVNGVPALWAISEPVQGDIAADGDPFTLWHDPNHSVFFEDLLKVSYNPVKMSFGLSSDSQIYTTRIVLADRRTNVAANGTRM